MRNLVRALAAVVAALLVIATVALAILPRPSAAASTAAVFVPAAASAVPAPRKPLPTAPAGPSPTGCAPQVLDVLAVGDSLTAGTMIGTLTSDGYRGELGRLLAATCVDARFTVYAVPGASCGTLAPQVAGLVATHAPDVMLLACGTNDLLLGASPSAVASWEAMYRGMVDTATAAGVLVYPALIQYSAYLPQDAKDRCHALGDNYASDLLADREAAANDAIVRAVALDADTPAFLNFQVIPEVYLDECGVHLTEAGYAVMGTLAYRTMARHFTAWSPVPEPCGMTGHRPGGRPLMFVPCRTAARS